MSFKNEGGAARLDADGPLMTVAAVAKGTVAAVAKGTVAAVAKTKPPPCANIDGV